MCGVYTDLSTFIHRLKTQPIYAEAFATWLRICFNFLAPNEFPRDALKRFSGLAFCGIIWSRTKFIRALNNPRLEVEGFEASKCILSVCSVGAIAKVIARAALGPAHHSRLTVVGHE